MIPTLVLKSGDMCNIQLISQQTTMSNLFRTKWIFIHISDKHKFQRRRYKRWTYPPPSLENLVLKPGAKCLNGCQLGVWKHETKLIISMLVLAFSSKLSVHAVNALWNKTEWWHCSICNQNKWPMLLLAFSFLFGGKLFAPQALSLY